jgi:SpoVK/Ycf46/Vps4 family AAA+-type ATPase
MALLSRFDVKIHVPLPTAAGIRQMLAAGMDVDGDVDLDDWAERLAAPGQNFSGRDIHNGLCKQATFRAFKRWQGDRSQSEIASERRLSSSATIVTNDDLTEVLKGLHGSSGVKADDWQRYEQWATGDTDG